jgi:hypothetical protein
VIRLNDLGSYWTRVASAFGRLSPGVPIIVAAVSDGSVAVLVRVQSNA